MNISLICSCTWLGDSSLSCSLPWGLASAFCSASSSFRSLAYEPSLHVFFSSCKCLVKPRTSASEAMSKFCLFNTFQNHDNHFFFSFSPASYSQPILSGPVTNSNSTGEVTFSCSSDNGYPEPNVYWINRTDNRRLLPSELSITLHDDGTYSVLSTLKVKATSDMQIECFIENKRLQENISANCKFLHDTSSCFLDRATLVDISAICSSSIILSWEAYKNSVVLKKKKCWESSVFFSR